jgi:hypothetical protein
LHDIALDATAEPVGVDDQPAIMGNEILPVRRSISTSATIATTAPER